VHDYYYKGIPHVLKEVLRFLNNNPWAPVAILPGARGHDDIQVNLRKPSPS
jgi:hypothetical protein